MNRRRAITFFVYVMAWVGGIIQPKGIFGGRKCSEIWIEMEELENLSLLHSHSALIREEVKTNTSLFVVYADKETLFCHSIASNTRIADIRVAYLPLSLPSRRVADVGSHNRSIYT